MAVSYDSGRGRTCTIRKKFKKIQILKEEVQYVIQAYNDILADEYDDEYAFHLFQNSGEEIALPNLGAFTDNHIDDYKSTDTAKEYEGSIVCRQYRNIYFIDCKKHG